MKPALPLLPLLAFALMARAQEEVSLAFDDSGYAIPAVAYESTVIYESPVVYEAPVIYYGPVYYVYNLGEPAGQPACAPAECAAPSTVFVIGEQPGTSYSYAKYGGDCGSTVIYFGGGWGHRR